MEETERKIIKKQKNHKKRRKIRKIPDHSIKNKLILLNFQFYFSHKKFSIKKKFNPKLPFKFEYYALSTYAVEEISVHKMFVHNVHTGKSYQ